MSALPVDAGPLLLRPAVESRPPAQRWGIPDSASDDHRGQPSLLDALREMLDDAHAPPRPRGVRFHGDTGPGSVRPIPGLPEPAGWAAVLGLAVGQVLVGARPVSQLESWLDAPVLADLRCDLRTRARLRPSGPAGPAPAAPPVRVVSVRTQCPTPTSVEATVCARGGAGSLVLGARLEAYGQRWLCTALVRPTARENVSGLRLARDTA